MSYITLAQVHCSRFRCRLALCSRCLKLLLRKSHSPWGISHKIWCSIFLSILLLRFMQLLIALHISLHFRLCTRIALYLWTSHLWPNILLHMCHYACCSSYGILERSLGCEHLILCLMRCLLSICPSRWFLRELMRVTVLHIMMSSWLLKWDSYLFWINNYKFIKN